MKTCLKVMGDFTDHFLHSQGSQSDISLTTFPAHHLERRDRQSAQCAVRRRGVVGRRPPTCVDSVSCRCALFHVLNCTTPKSTHNGTCENSPHPLQHSTLCFVISPSPSRYLPFIMYMYNIHGTHSYTFNTLYIVIACTCHLRLK